MQNSFAADALRGRTALVTGAASGIGKETALVLASLGAFVWATDLNAEGLKVMAEQLGGHGATARHDVTSEDDWREIISQVRAKDGRLDVLVNNAGIMLNQAFVDTTLDIWRRQQAINVESVFLGMRSAFALMSETAKTHAASPSIINVSSIYGIIAGSSFAAYSASKGAVRALTKAVANEFVRHGIRVNSLHPGPTQTNLGSNWEPPRGPDGDLLSEAEIGAAWLRLLPMQRFGSTADMASAIAYLACDASSYVTGTELIVDGGYSMV